MPAQIDRLFRPVFWIAAAVFVLVEGLLVVALFRFRRPARGRTPGSRSRSTATAPWRSRGRSPRPSCSPRIAVPTIATIFSLDARPAEALESASSATSGGGRSTTRTGRGDGQRDAHPGGRARVRDVESRAHVIHSFWVPRLAGKQDLVPGSVHHLTFEADEPGRLPRASAPSTAAISHANMRFRGRGPDAADFQTWVARAAAAGRPASAPDVLRLDGRCGLRRDATPSTASRGSIGPPEVGPDLTHFASRAKFAGRHLRADPGERLPVGCHDAPSRKPGQRHAELHRASGVHRTEIDAMVQYLESLK